MKPPKDHLNIHQAGIMLASFIVVGAYARLMIWIGLISKDTRLEGAQWMMHVPVSFLIFGFISIFWEEHIPDCCKAVGATRAALSYLTIFLIFGIPVLSWICNYT